MCVYSFLTLQILSVAYGQGLEQTLQSLRQFKGVLGIISLEVNYMGPVTRMRTRTRTLNYIGPVTWRSVSTVYELGRIRVSCV